MDLCEAHCCQQYHPWLEYQPIMQESDKILKYGQQKRKSLESKGFKILYLPTLSVQEMTVTRTDTERENLHSKNTAIKNWQGKQPL